MGIITGVTARGSNQQNNTVNIENIGGKHFSYFSMIGSNLFEEFEAFRGNNNNSPLGNNNNNNSSPLPSPGLGEEFNPLLEGNAEELDPNVAALVNVLTGANLRINHVERESNHVKPTEFRETEAENPNE